MRRLALIVALAGLLAARPHAASAHPLGNFTINHYAGLELGTDGLTVDYVLDLAEIPTFQMRADIAPAPSAACASLADGLSVSLDGATLGLRTAVARVAFLPGQGGLEILRLECSLTTSWRLGSSTHVLTFADATYLDRIGWREITARGDGVVIETSLPASSLSERLTAYPQDAFASSPGVRSGEVRFTVGMPVEAASPVVVPLPRGGDAVADLLGRADSGALGPLLALVLAFGLGALHAASPGHGKTVMAAYLVGTRRSVRDAVTLGLAVAVSHTAGVLALAVVVLTGASLLPPERVYPILSAASALVVVAVGLTMLRRELAHRASHRRLHDHQHAQSVGAGSLVALGLVGGLVPSASALVLLLGALAAHRPDAGVLLVLAFGVGMASTLVGAGVALVAAGRLAARAPLAKAKLASRVVALGPMLAALVVLAIGIGLTAQSLAALV